MLQGLGDAVLVHRVRHIVCLGLYRLVGIAHGDADARMAQHGDVVAPVADGHRVRHVDAEVAAHQVDAQLLVAAQGRDVHEGGVPAANLAVGQQRPDCPFLLLVEEGGQLADVRDEAQGLGRGHAGHFLGVQVFHEHPAQGFAGVAGADVLLVHHGAGDAVRLAVVQDGLHLRGGNHLFVEHLVAHVAIAAVHRDVAVDEAAVLQGAQVVDEARRTARGDEHADAAGVGGGDGLDGGGRNLVRLEADERAVYVKEYRFCHNAVWLKSDG